MGVSLKLIWDMISSLQLVVHLPLFAFNIPANVKFVCSLVIRLFKFDILDTSMLNGNLFGVSKEGNGNNLSSLEYGSDDIISNMGTFFYLILGIVLLYFILYILKKITVISKVIIKIESIVKYATILNILL